MEDNYMSNIYCTARCTVQTMFAPFPTPDQRNIIGQTSWRPYSSHTRLHINISKCPRRPIYTCTKTSQIVFISYVHIICTYDIKTIDEQLISKLCKLTMEATRNIKELGQLSHNLSSMQKVHIPDTSLHLYYLITQTIFNKHTVLAIMHLP